MSVFVAVPVYRSYSGWARWTQNLLTLKDQLPEGSEIDFRVGTQGISLARNILTEKMLKKRHEWILYLDDDTMPNTNRALKGAQGLTTLEWIMALDKPVVTALVPRCGAPHNPPIGDWCPDGKPRDILDFPWDRPFRVDYCGGACLLVHRDVFGEIRKPWWMKLQDPFMSEDIRFGRSLKEVGIPLWVEPRAWCVHIRGGYFYGMLSYRRYLERDDLNRWISDERYSAR